MMIRRELRKLLRRASAGDLDVLIASLDVVLHSMKKYPAKPPETRKPALLRRVSGRRLIRTPKSDNPDWPLVNSR